MTKEQKLYKVLILADLKIVAQKYSNDNKAISLLAGYHVQQQIQEKKRKVNDTKPYEQRRGKNGYILLTKDDFKDWDEYVKAELSGGYGGQNA